MKRILYLHHMNGTCCILISAVYCITETVFLTKLNFLSISIISAYLCPLVNFCHLWQQVAETDIDACNFFQTSL